MRVAIISFQKNTNIIGAKYLHAWLQKHGHESFLIMQPNDDSDDIIFQFIQDRNIQMVGISHLSGEYYRSIKFAKKFKQITSNIPLVVGGVHATIAPEDWDGIADAVFRGEAEYSFLKYIEEGVKETVQANKNLDIFPFPQIMPNNMFIVTGKKKIEHINQKLLGQYTRYSGKFPDVLTSRGCPFSCSFCVSSSYKKIFGKIPVRKRSVENVIEECKEFLEFNPIAINIQDENFLSQPNDWIIEFSKQWQKLIKLPFTIRTIPIYVTPEKIRALKSAGLNIVCMGLQTGSYRINKEIYNRKIRTEDYLRACEIINSHKLPMLIDVIVDNPWESEKDILETLDVLLQVPKPFQVLVYSLVYYDGTPIKERAIREGFLINDDSKKANYHITEDINLNHLIKLVPIYPRFFVKKLLIHRKKILIKKLVKLLDNNIAWCFSMFKLMIMAYGFQIFKIVFYFGKTALLKKK